MRGIEEIELERISQPRKGYDQNHDKHQQPEDFLHAAVAVLNGQGVQWPLPTPWKPKRTLRERMIVAGALCAAGIDRLDMEAVEAGEAPTEPPRPPAKPEPSGIHARELHGGALGMAPDDAPA